MTNWFSTYVVKSPQSLHALTRGCGIPTNFSFLGERLIRVSSHHLASFAQIGDVHLSETFISRPNNTFDGAPVQMIARFCLGKGAGAKKKKVRAVQKQDAMKIWCDTAGVEKVYESNQSYAKIVAHEPLQIKPGINDVNVFTVQGLFKVIDFGKFEKAYNEGIGTRKSYGNGLVIVL